MVETTDTGTMKSKPDEQKEASFTVEVVYALPEEQTLLSVPAWGGETVQQVIDKSGILQMYPELDREHLEVGIFGKLARLDQTVRDRDRIEIYRPLIADPKEVRKKRAAEGKRLKKGGG